KLVVPLLSIVDLPPITPRPNASTLRIRRGIGRCADKRSAMREKGCERRGERTWTVADRNSAPARPRTSKPGIKVPRHYLRTVNMRGALTEPTGIKTPPFN